MGMKFGFWVLLALVIGGGAEAGSLKMLADGRVACTSDELYRSPSQCEFVGPWPNYHRTLRQSWRALRCGGHMMPSDPVCVREQDFSAEMANYRRLRPELND